MTDKTRERFEEWRLINELDHGFPVHLWASSNYGHRHVIGYRHGNKYFALNHNACEEGSELLQWEPTHWRKLETSPDGVVSNIRDQAATADCQALVRELVEEVGDLKSDCEGIFKRTKSLIDEAHSGMTRAQIVLSRLNEFLEGK